MGISDEALSRKRLTEPVWRERLAQHEERLAPFAIERIARMARREKHPVRDFLFEYYAYRPAQLLRWSPGCDVVLENARPGDVEWTDFTATDGGLVLTAYSFPFHRRSFVRWGLQYLEGIAARPPLYGCFGLHEWAMVYRTAEVRHPRTPLRVTPETIAATVDSEELCCTHFDAFRFFTPTAVPRNRFRLTRDITDQHDQRGCVHVTIDLYRYAHKISPWVSGELIADTFLLAWKARELDMRASPYDLSCYGLDPIRIETRAGREEYVESQQALAEEAVPLRQRLIAEYRKLVAATADSPVSGESEWQGESPGHTARAAGTRPGMSGSETEPPRSAGH
jgi:hypothetical protein